MRKFIENLPFEYLLSAFVIIGALLILKNIAVLFVVLFILSILLAWRINFCKGIFCFAALTLMLIVNFWRNLPEKDSLKKLLDGRSVYGKIRFEVIDPLCNSSERIKNGATVRIRILNIATAAGENLCGGGNFLLYAKDILPSDCIYGDVFESNGTLRFAESHGAWNHDGNFYDNDYRFGDFYRYMKLHKIDGMVSVDREFVPVKCTVNDSVMRRMLKIRDAVLEYFIKDIEKDENADFAAAIFFGLRGAVDAGSKNDFIKSGTIHLFSVSGLHVGILFAVLLVLLIFVPVRYRYLFAVLLLIPFVVSTGANVPAIRAFVMILFFAVLRSSCFYVPPLRILALGCSGFLIWHADYLADAGFLYSFGITAVLLLVSTNISQWNRIWTADISLMAINRKNQRRYSGSSYFLRKTLFALCGTAAAFAAGSIITLFTFGHLYLAAVWINFFIIFYCTWLTYLFVLKMIFTPVWYIGAVCGKIFEKALDIMQYIIEFGAAYPCRINSIQISWEYILLFYFALIMILICRNKIIFAASGVLLIIFFPVAVICSNFQKTELLVMREPSGNQVSFVLAEPKAGSAWCFNIQSSAEAELARKFLSVKGISKVNLWIQSGNAKSKFNALKNMMKNTDVYKMIHISRLDFSENSDFMPGIIYEQYKYPLNNWEVKEPLCRFFRKKTEIGFEYFNTEAIIPLYIVFDEENQELKIVENGVDKKRKLINSNILEYFVYEL